MLIYLSSAWHPNIVLTPPSTLSWLIQAELCNTVVFLDNFTSPFLIMYLVDYFYGGPLVFWSAYGLDSLPNNSVRDDVSYQGHVLLLLLLTVNSYIVSAASFHIFFQKILSSDGCMWMCVDGQRPVHLFASLAIFTSGKERLLEVESKTLLEGGQLASALISQTEQCTHNLHSWTDSGRKRAYKKNWNYTASVTN